MDESDIYWIDARNADVRVQQTNGGRPTRPGAVVHGTRIYPATNHPYGQPQMVYASRSPYSSQLFGNMNAGQLVDLVSQIFAALMPLPAAPVATADATTDVGNLITYQSALAQYAKRDEQVRTLGSLVTKLVG
jgi:hypothetical protein